MANNNRKKAVKKIRLLSYNPKIDVNLFRKKIEEEFKTVFLPCKTERTERTFGGITCDLLTPEIFSTKRIVFYIHGGCFIGGSRESYRAFASTVANKAYSRVVVPEYRLAPAHPFPAAVEDVQMAFRALFTEEQIARSLEAKTAEAKNPELRREETETPCESENDPEIIIVSDGAGASIACALIFNLRERYKKCIKKAVFFSPWLDISPKTTDKKSRKLNDEILSTETLSKSADAYTYSSNLTNPLVSPLAASRELLQDFPSTYIQVGKKELLAPDAKQFCKNLIEAGSDCILDEWPDMMHLFQIADEYLEEAHEAMDKFSWIVSAGMESKQNTSTISIDNKPKLEYSLRSEA